MANLLSFAQQQSYKKISANNSGKYDQLALEVENKELSDLLGVALLQDLQTNPTSTNNLKLLNGDTFIDCNGNSIKHRGLRFVLAYLNYSRYIGESMVNDTFTGFVVKTRPDSEQISEGYIKRLQAENRSIALKEFQIIKEYLEKNTDTYTLWDCTEKRKPFTPRIYGIRKTIK